MNTVMRVLIATAVATAAATSHAVLVVDYKFDEPTGPLSTAVDSTGGTIAPWGADADAVLNGAGQLVVNGPLNFQARGFTGPGAISSGTAFVRIDFDSWGPSADRFFVFGMRASGPSTGNQSWRLQFSSGDATDGDPAGRLVEVGAHSLDGGFNFLNGSIPVESGLNGSLPNGLSVIMGIDLDSDTTSVWWDPDRTGAYAILGGRENVAIDSSNGYTDFDLVDALQMQANGGPFAIDRFALGTSFAEIAAIPEPSVVVVFAALSVVMASACRRGSRGPS